MFIKRTKENAFLKTSKLVFHVKNAFHSLVNAFINKKKHSESSGTHSLLFHIFMEYFPLSSKFILCLDRKCTGSKGEKADSVIP